MMISKGANNMGINLNSVANFFVGTRNDLTADGKDGLTNGNSASMSSFNPDIGWAEQTSATTDTGTFSLLRLFKRLLSTKLPLGANTTANALCAAPPTDDGLRTSATSIATNTGTTATNTGTTATNTGTIVTNTGATATSTASIDTKLNATNGALGSIDTKVTGKSNIEVNYSWTRPADATTYTIGDMFSDSTTTPTVPVWSGLVATAGDTAELVKVTFSSSHNTLYNVRLFLFKATPTTAADNLANTIADSDILSTNCVGYVDIGPLVAVNLAAGAAGNAFIVVVPPIPIRFNTGATTGLFGAFVVLAGTTPIASAVLNCTLHVRRVIG